MKRVEKRLYAEAVTSGKELSFNVVPQHDGKLAAKASKALNTEFFIEVQDNFTVRAGAKMMAAMLSSSFCMAS